MFMERLGLVNIEDLQGQCRAVAGALHKELEDAQRGLATAAVSIGSLSCGFDQEK